jgi:hypothetical protein
MKFGFYAFDVGPSKMLRMIADRAKKMGHEILFVPPQKEGLAMDYFEELKTCDVVLGGLSSFRVKDGCMYPILEEEWLIRALSQENVPYVMIEDAPEVSLKPFIMEASGLVAGLIVAFPQWVEKIETTDRFAYKNVKHLGPPAHWRVSYEDMIYSDLRERCSKTRINEGEAPLAPNDKIVFYGGGKAPRQDNEVLEAVVEACHLALGDSFVLAFRRHPGEGQVNDPDAFARREEILHGIWMISGTDDPDITMGELVGASDLTVFANRNTDAIVAAYARVPEIFYYTSVLRERNKALGSKDGSWSIVEDGGVWKTDGKEELRVAVAAFLDDDSPERRMLLESQCANYPVPKDWDTAPKIVRYLENFVRERNTPGFVI